MFAEQENRFVAALAQARQDSSVTLTPAARDLLFLMIDAVTRDPHPRWREREDFRRLGEFQSTLIDRLPDELGRLASASHTNRISTFDILHAASGIVDRLCEFDKI